MHTSEFLGVLLFLVFVVGIFAGAGVTLLFWISRFLRKKPRPLKRSEQALLLLGAAGLACLAYGYFIEPYWPQITHTVIKTEKLPRGAAPIRLVLLSDIHSDPTVRLEHRLAAMIVPLKPHAILFAGDSVNSPEGLPNFKRALSSLAVVAPTFVARGNWDAFWPALDFFGGTGARDLQGRAERLLMGGNSIWIAGLDVRPESLADRQARAGRSLRQIPSKELIIFIHHYPYPDTLSEADQKRVDLFGAGHVHGGQVALPFYGAILTLSRFGKQFERGLYEIESGMKLYVSRGIGMEGGMAPRVRFFSRPEIAVLELVPA